MKRTVAITAMLIMCLIGCSSKKGPTSSTEDGGADVSSVQPTTKPAVEASTSTDDWTRIHTKDPINDAISDTVSKTISDEKYRVKVSVSCVNGEDVRYVFEPTNLGGASEPFTFEISTGYGIISKTSSFEMRVDDAQARTLQSEQKDTDNMVSYQTNSSILESSPYFTPDKVFGFVAAAGSHITARLHLINGIETIAFEQSSPTFQAAVKPCLDDMLRKAKAAKERADAAMPLPATPPIGFTAKPRADASATPVETAAPDSPQ